MKSGLKRPTYDRRDRDFGKSFGATPVQIPDSYDVDSGLWNPNQNTTNAPTGLDVIPPLPYGCTDYTQADLCIDEDGKLYSPMLLEQVTHANALGGLDIRIALKATTQVFNRGAYYQITAQQPLDMFTAIQLAMLSTASEKRAVSVGTPFWPEWMTEGVLPTPPDFSLSRASWHNWKISGWRMIGDQPYLLCKMWTGDWKYMSRALCNQVFAIRGSVAYTLSKYPPPQVQTIDFNFVKWLVSWVQSILSSQTPVTIPTVLPLTPPQPKYMWDNPLNAKHSVRVICDEEGLSLADKNTICAVIMGESEFYNTAKNQNKNAQGIVTSTDWGICQINDRYHIGPKLDFPSVQYVLDNPDAAVRFMIHMYRAGKISLWCAYANGSYKKYL